MTWLWSARHTAIHIISQLINCAHVFIGHVVSVRALCLVVIFFAKNQGAAKKPPTKRAPCTTQPVR
jgi:hypothetical protein